MSMIFCQHGLFVGVDRHAKLPEQEWLTNAAFDAETFREYFLRALPESSADCWRTLKGGKRKQPPKQVDILRAIDAFAKNVPSGEGGVFYFSGHAAVSQRGLVLKSYDAHDEFLDYTGLPFARVLELLKRQGGAGKRFFVILDCCRDGGDQAAADDIPANVCVLYACGHGAETYESNSGGTLTRSIIESLEVIAEESGAKSCSVRSLCNRLGRQLFAWRPSCSLSFELYGTWADRLYLPITVNLKEPRGRRPNLPSSVLQYCFGSKAEFEAGVKKVAFAIFEWYGIPSHSEAGKTFVFEHLTLPKRTANSRSSFAETEDGPPDNYTLEVRLPDGCARWLASEFLVCLLYALPGVPQTLILNWNQPVQFSAFKLFEHAIGGEWIGGGGDTTDTRLFWRNGGNQEYRGVASVVTEGSATSVVFSCETVEGLFSMPLSYLLPALQDVYDLFRNVQIVERD